MSMTAKETDPTIGEARSVSSLGALCQLAEILTQIAAAFQIMPSEFADSESLQRLEKTIRVPAACLLEITNDTMVAWFDAFEDDLEIRLTASGLDPYANYPTTTLRFSETALSQYVNFVEDVNTLCRAGDDGFTIDAHVVVNKKNVTRHAHVALEIRHADSKDARPEAPINLCVFYFTAALNRWMSFKAMQSWETRHLVSPAERTVIVLCDRPGYLAGPALEILGAAVDFPVRWLHISRSAWHNFQVMAQKTRDLRDEESSWTNAPNILTPAHLRLQMRHAGLEGIEILLNRLQEALSAAYMATSVQKSNRGDLIARYSGARPSSCNLTSSESPAAGLTSATDGTLTRFAIWAYESGSPDKLAICRECLAIELPSGSHITLSDLERVAARAFESSKANFFSYLRRNAENYFRLRSQALEVLNKHVDAVYQSIRELSRGVIENVFRVAGLLVAIIVSGVLQPTLSVNIQKFATVVLIMYVCFILIYLMRTQERQKKLHMQDSRTVTNAFAELSEGERDNLQAAIDRASSEFDLQFSWAKWIYLGLCIVGALYFILLWTPLSSVLFVP